MATETVLRDWRFGQAQAERLAAALLHLEGYTDVDPQHPLGGPDGIKDVLCRRGPSLFVAAAYFPATQPTKKEITRKFVEDLAGVKKNNAEGFCFFVNQYLTVSERGALLTLAGDDVHVEIYHLERMRGMLDSAQGCGSRLEYLRIAMSEEEQFAFWSSSNYKLSEQLVRIEARQQQTHDALLAAMDSLTSRTNHMHDDLRQRISSTLQPASSEAVVSGFPTAQLDVGLLCWIHRLTVNDGRVPALISGQLRTQNVWVGSLDENAPSYSPPPPQEVPTLIASWASFWRNGYRDAQRATRDGKILSLTNFYYELLRIHPFLDGNGRVADALLDQAARELLQRSVLQSLNIDRIDHQRALFAANSGNLTPLRIRITAALS